MGEYFIRRRVLIYLFDRLARKLIVEGLKGERTEILDKCIIELFLLTKSLLNNVIGEIRNPKELSAEHFEAFKTTHPLSATIITILRKDCEYVEDSLCDILSEPLKLSKK